MAERHSERRIGRHSRVSSGLIRRFSRERVQVCQTCYPQENGQVEQPHGLILGAAERLRGCL